MPQLLETKMLGVSSGHCPCPHHHHQQQQPRQRPSQSPWRKGWALGQLRAFHPACLTRSAYQLYCLYHPMYCLYCWCQMERELLGLVVMQLAG